MPDGWVRSSTCSANSCLEVGEVGKALVLRDSEGDTQDGLGDLVNRLFVSRVTFAEFIAGAKKGDFDALLELS